MTDQRAAKDAFGADGSAISGPCVLRAGELDALFAALHRRGYTVIGPTRRDGAIVLDELTSAAELPAGWRDVQAPGSYRLEQRDDEALFGHVVGPHSFKRWLHVPEERLVQLRRSGRSFEAIEAAPVARKLALLGARACEIAAIHVQDRVLMHGAVPDPRYAARRASVLVIGVACNEPGGTCFCTSMGGGPRPTEGYDLTLTELLPSPPRPHRFLIGAGTSAGREIVAELGCVAAEREDVEAADHAEAVARGRMGRQLDTTDIQRLLYDAAEHPRWDDVAARCLACTSCTLVCPTCFCSRVSDTTSLDGETAERVRRWDSCFSLDYSHVHGGPTRTSVAARYRHWLTHKLASWIDQFGTSGCVGCGRCVTWCPAAIDITEEIAAIRREPSPPRSKRS